MIVQTIGSRPFQSISECQVEMELVTRAYGGSLSLELTGHFFVCLFVFVFVWFVVRCLIIPFLCAD